MKYKVTIAMNASYTVEASNEEEAEEAALVMTPDEADDVEILDVVTLPKAN